MYNLRKRTNDNVSNEASDWESMTRCFVENRENHQPERRTQDMITRHYKPRRAAGIEVSALKLRLICSLTKRRIVVPARSVNCTHVQCFDLASYLRMQMTAEHPAWTCPICRVPADTGRLQIDEYVSKVLASEQTQAAEVVTLLQDGTFEPAVSVPPASVVTQEDLELVVNENPLNVEDIKPDIGRGRSASNDASADLASSDKPDNAVDEPSAPAKRARLDAKATKVERIAQPASHVDLAEASQVFPDATQTRTLSSVSGHLEQAGAGVDAHPPTTGKCWQWFTSKQSFVEHRSKQHLATVTPGPCAQCSSRAENREIYHCEDYHEVRPFSCTKCSRSFYQEEQLDGHGTDHDSPHRTRCHICGGIFRHLQALAMHMKGAHHEKIDWCFVCKDVFHEDEQEHVSSDAHQETMKLKAACKKLKISCAHCSKPKYGTQFLVVHGIQANVRRVSLAKDCEECRRKLVKAAEPLGESARIDLPEILRMVAEQESTAAEEMKRKQQRSPRLLEAETKAREAIKKIREEKKKAREAKKTSDQKAKAQASSTTMSSNSSGGLDARPAQAQLAHRTHVQHGPWLQPYPTASAFGYPAYQGTSYPFQIRTDHVPNASGQFLPQLGHCPPYPPTRPPPTAKRHVLDEYYRQLGMFYEQRMHGYPH